jgi:hypothetical protein
MMGAERAPPGPRLTVGTLEIGKLGKLAAKTQGGNSMKRIVFISTFALALFAYGIKPANASDHCWDSGPNDTPFGYCDNFIPIPGIEDIDLGSGPGCALHDMVSRCLGGVYTPWAIVAMGPAAVTIAINGVEAFGSWLWGAVSSSSGGGGGAVMDYGYSMGWDDETMGFLQDCINAGVRVEME